MLEQFSLEGKVALVTGAAYGIGFAIAEAFANAGAKIAFNCRGEAHMAAALDAYAAKGIDAKGYFADVTNEADVIKLVADIERDLGTIDILVNNAGIIRRVPMLEMEAADFREVIDIDLVAPFIAAKHVIPGMIRKGHGKIINICSMMSELGRETVSAYAAAKGGLKMLTRNICAEYGKYNIQCNGIGRRRHPCASPSRTAAAIPSTTSSFPRPRLSAGAMRTTSWARPCSSPPTRRTSSTDRCCTLTAASSPTLAASRK